MTGTALDHHLARRFWHLVAHRSELPGDRDYLRLPWLLGDIVAYNDRGEITVFDNLCPHRGARFFLDAAGNAPALCPYHGWSLRGGVLRVPRPDSYRPCDLAAARLNRFATAWCGDFLFAAIDPGTDLPTQLDAVGPVLEGISRDIAHRHALDAYVYECPWRVAVENALEPDHVHMVHADTLGSLRLTAARNLLAGRNAMFLAEVGDPRTLRALRAMRRLFDLRHGHEGYASLYLFPFSFVSSTFGYAYAVQSFLPAREVGRTEFTTRLLAARTVPGTEEATRPFLDSAAAMNRAIFEEDHAICRRVDPGFPFTGPLSATEEKLRHLREELAAISSGLNPAVA